MKLVEDYPFIATRKGDSSRPYLPITIVNPDNNKIINTYALIDTGADECAFPASFALPLGHNLQCGKQKKISTGNGITIAYRHTISLRIFKTSLNSILIDFMPNLNIPLLGVKNFLNNFILNIDYPNKKFSLINNITNP